ASRLARGTATRCAGPLDLVTNPPRQNGSIWSESALTVLINAGLLPAGERLIEVSDLGVTS
nr:hypothetical protein [Alphaproteobacteria bacterium]